MKRKFSSLREVSIVAAGRSPIKSYRSNYYNLPFAQLGATILTKTLDKHGIPPSELEEFYLANVLNMNLGQNPAKQVINKADYSDNIICHSINKVCSSGILATYLAAMTIRQGYADTIAIGGIEVMSSAPLMKPRNRKNEDGKLIDSLFYEGLTDSTHNILAGDIGEAIADRYLISREEMDEYAKLSFNRAKTAWETGKFDREVIPVPGRMEELVYKDDIRTVLDFSKLKPAFRTNGKLTSGNTPPISDGAAAIVLTSTEKARNMGWRILGKILSVGHAEVMSLDFPIAPAKAVPIALERAGLSVSDIDLWELNEAFAVVNIINNRELGIDLSKENIYGGAISLGHPIGCSGVRIIVTLLNALETEKKELGVATLCNGMGGGSALVISRE